MIQPKEIQIKLKSDTVPDKQVSQTVRLSGCTVCTTTSPSGDHYRGVCVTQLWVCATSELLMSLRWQDPPLLGNKAWKLDVSPP